MTTLAERTDSWLGHFASQRASAPWVERLRHSGYARFSDLGFPTVHDEDWRFTNVAPIARTAFEPAPAVEADADAHAPFTKGIRFVFINGRLQKLAPSLPLGVNGEHFFDEARAYLARHASYDKNPFTALNTAFLGDVAWLRLDRDTSVNEPIHFLYLTLPGAVPAVSHPRTLILVGERSRCSIVETYVGAGAYFNNPVTEIILEPGASLDHYKVQMESTSAFHVATLEAAVGRGASYSTTSISLGASLVRNNSNTRLSEGAEAILNGLYLVNGAQHADNQLVVDHAQPNATSHQLYKGVLDGMATAAFNGKILVRNNAQRTDAKQTNKNLILSDKAVVNTKPELQILADDVRCTHGATIGQLDREAEFYLQSRGIEKKNARSMLTRAFAQDVIDRIKVPSIRSILEGMIVERLYGSR